jgi:hypothetical protein
MFIPILFEGLLEPIFLGNLVNLFHLLGQNQNFHILKWQKAAQKNTLLTSNKH